MYQIYALKYAERDTTACQFFFREHSHDPITLHYFVWLILGGPHPVLVDTGFMEDDVERRGIRNYVRPSLMVERMGVKLADIRSEEHTSELQSQSNLVCRLLLEKKKKKNSRN